MGELRGLVGLDAPRRIEVLPYTLGRLERSPGDRESPFYSANALTSAVGADLKIARDFREGRSAVGVIATAVNRDGDVADALSLRRDAYAAGVDFRHRFGSDAYEAAASFVGTRVSGSERST
jgi:hypothetical protein